LEVDVVVERTRLTDDALDLVAMRFRSLGETTRLKILRLLEAGEMSVGQLVERLGSSQANVSKHLKILVSAGVLSRRVQGTSVYYSISDPVILKICDTVCSGLAENLKSQAAGFGYRLTMPRRRR
jgi:DNA-binding transcriptional ArsR family regulator